MACVHKPVSDRIYHIWHRESGETLPNLTQPVRFSANPSVTTNQDLPSLARWLISLPPQTYLYQNF